MKTILVLANDGMVGAIFRYMLREFNVIEATTAEEALTLFRDRQLRFDILLADVTLPAVSGVQVALLLRFHDPNLPVILTSDYSISYWLVPEFPDFEKLASFRTVFLQKPFQTEVLVNAVNQLLRTSVSKPVTAMYKKAGS